MTQGLAGHHVVVLGASNPTGLAIAAGMAAAGAVVDVLARTPEQAELIELRLGGVEGMHASALDFASEPAFVEASRRIVVERGAVDHVVVCLRYGGRGDAVWGGEGEIGEVYRVMAATFLPCLPEGGSFDFLVCGDRPSVGLQPEGPALVRAHEATARAWAGTRRVFLLAAGPDDAAVAEQCVQRAADPSRASERIVMPGAFVGDPSWEELLAARTALDARLSSRE
ncbi:MAG: hypothetical protein LBE25_15520 [Arthrobacter sp.]|jgi:hypothetical protein|nr:hypothetical protein [Arthrobacter sp.]